MTIENIDGELASVKASGDNYENALAAARGLIPEGCKALSIRTTTDE